MKNEHNNWKYLLLMLVVLFSLSACTRQSSLTFYVDSAVSTATGDGSAERPFASPLEARDALRKMQGNGGLQGVKEVHVVLADGVYKLTETLSFDERDNLADGRIIYEASNKGKAVLTLSKEMSSTDFTPVTDVTVLKMMSPEAQEHVQVIDLKQRYPGIEFQPLDLYYGGMMAGPWIYCDAGESRMARWPNEGWAEFTTAIDHGGHDGIDPGRGGAFLFKTDRGTRWNVERGDVFVEGYMTYDWRDERIAIASYEPVRGVIRLASSTSYGVGVSTWNNPQRRFRILNALSELDSPGEWYLDRKNGLLYIWHLKDTPVHYYLQSELIPLVQMTGVRGVDFIGLGIKYCYEAFRMEDCSDCNLSGLDVTFVVNDAITMKGDHITVSGCEMAYLGCCGIVVDGGDRLSLTNAENLIENNHIHDFSLYKPTYTPAINLNGCGSIVRNNYIHDAPHNAMLFSGNEHIIERNEICNVLKVTDDAGAIYTGRDWTLQGVKIRHNYIHDIIPINPKHNCSMAIYLDDCAGGTTIEGNILLRVARGMMIGGGRDNNIHGNAMIGCNIGLSVDARAMKGEWAYGEWDDPKGWNLAERAEAMHYRESPWKDRYPNLARIMEESPREPLHNELIGNFFHDCGRDVYWENNSMQKVIHKLTIMDNVSVQDSTMEIDKLTLDDLKGWADRYELFRSIPMDSIGLLHAFEK